MSENKLVYFPGLNGVRSFAVFIVVFLHIESFKQRAGYSSLFDFDFLKDYIEYLGYHGVLIFFVLSGFLITYLLLSEKDKTATINIPKFYIRRILRIWPLYFLILFLGFFILPHVFSPNYFTIKTQPDFFNKLISCILFIPNYVLFKYGSIFSIGILWSIGAEEQFYLVWPNLIKRIKRQNLLKVMTGLLVLIVFVKAICYYLIHKNILYKIAFIVFNFLPFDAMIIGGITALLYFDYKDKIGFLFNRKVQIFLLLLLIIVYAILPEKGPIANIIFCPIYAILILNISIGKDSIIKADHPILIFLGTISYGIYIYHSLFIAVSIFIIEKMNLSFNTTMANTLLYFLSFSLTIVVSSISYKYLEKPFLKLKTRFMIVKSGKIY